MKFFKKNWFALLLIVLSLIINSCASISFGTTEMDDSESNSSSKNEHQLSQIQKNLVLVASYYKGSTGGTLVSDNKTYTLDCSGAILAIYYKSGIYLEKCYSEYSGNGVRRIHDCLQDHNLLYITKKPMPGDLVFWDNTYDKNSDGKFNDYLTHVGMVVSVDQNGTITYIHDNYKKGLVYEKMNLYRPKDRELNSAMRMRSSPKGPNNESLAGELVRAFGQAWLLPRKYYR